jgi:hypothetical protein
MKTTGEKCVGRQGSTHRKETTFVPKVVTKVRLEEQEQDLPQGDKVPAVNWLARNGTGGTSAVAQAAPG